ncbi:FAD-binding, type 2-like superfamily [Sesbania bispinosa]|nr:FAD-binding, type 2-like superfamily [Sesbania bispinosa]
MGNSYWIWWLFGVIHILPFFGSNPLIHGMTPQSPIQCTQTGCTLRNSYGIWGDRKDCYALNVTYPTTEEQLRLAVSYAVQNNLKAKGVTIGGLISTGAHGSSWWGKGGAVHDHVLGISIVVPASKSEGYAKILRLEAQNPLLNAAKVSLGVLGAISKVKLSLEPRFKRSITYNFTDDTGIEDVYIDHAKKYEFADITWYPSRHTAVYRYDSRVPLNAPEVLLEKSRNVKGKCLTAATTLGYKKLVANGLKNNGVIFTGYPVVGYQGKMQTSGSCLYSTRLDTTCAWDPRFKGLLFYESTAIFPASKFGDFIHDVRKLRDINPDNFCGIDNYNGILIRFIKASDAYLGQSEDSVVVDFNYYRSDDPSTPRLSQDVWEEVEQLAFFKYGAKPHWAKNRNLAF